MFRQCRYGHLQQTSIIAEMTFWFGCSVLHRLLSTDLSLPEHALEHSTVASQERVGVVGLSGYLTVHKHIYIHVCVCVHVTSHAWTTCTVYSTNNLCQIHAHRHLVVDRPWKAA